MPLFCVTKRVVTREVYDNIEADSEAGALESVNEGDVSPRSSTVIDEEVLSIEKTKENT